MKKYNLTVVIGRFQPFHVIHLQLVRHALKLGESFDYSRFGKKSGEHQNPFFVGDARRNDLRVLLRRRKPLNQIQSRPGLPLQR